MTAAPEGTASAYAPHAARRSSGTPPQWLYAVLAAYVVGFAIFWPRALLVVDEERYVSQAIAFAQGHTTIQGAEILVPPKRLKMISDYPPGTSLLQTPLVWALGWRGAALLSVLSLVGASLLTARWLKMTGKNEEFAIVVPAFLGTALFGRIAMSDVPAAALVAGFCYTLWRSDGGRRVPSFGAGFLGGVALLVREPISLLVAPLALGAMLRRRVRPTPMLLGGLFALALRFVLAKAFFGSALYVRDPAAGFSLHSLERTVPVYSVILLVLFPAGALLPFLYRGPRRFEMVSAAALYVALFLLYDWDAVRGQGTLKGVLLSARFMVPLLPILAFMAADVWPRLVARLGEPKQRMVMRFSWLGAAGALVLAFGIHVLAHRQEREALTIVRAIQARTSAQVPVVTNTNATLKYLSPAYSPRRLILRYAITADSLPALAARYGTMTVALLDRTDSRMFRSETSANDAFLAAVRSRCTLRDFWSQQIGANTLYIANLGACGH